MKSESKAIIFGRYYGVMCLHVGGSKLAKVGYDGLNLKHPDFYLKLKPLSSISDEDAIEVAKINVYRYGKERTSIFDYHENIMNEPCSPYIKSLLINSVYNDEFQLSTYQYLQLKGYAIPQTVIEDGRVVTYTIEQLVEEGIFKLD